MKIKQKISLFLVFITVFSTLFQGCGNNNSVIVPASDISSESSENSSSSIDDNNASVSTDEINPDFFDTSDIVTLICSNIEDVDLALRSSSPLLRDAIDSFLDIKVTANGKNGVFFVNENDDYCSNISLKNVLHNLAFTKYLSDSDMCESFAKVISEQYSDLDDEDPFYIVCLGLNEYFGILPDCEEGVSSHNEYVSRIQFMASTARAGETSFAADPDTINAVFGDNPLGIYASECINDCYIYDESQQFNEENINEAITKAEAAYIVVNRFFKDELENAEISSDIDGNLPEEIRKALSVAKSLNLIDNYDNFEEPVTKGETMRLIVTAMMTDTSVEIYEAESYPEAADTAKVDVSEPVTASEQASVPEETSYSVPVPEPEPVAVPAVEPVSSSTSTYVAQGNCNIENVSSYAAIEGDISVTGSGTGYFAKFVICTATSAISFGIQYDSCANAPYTGKTMVMMENVLTNSLGNQIYDRPGNIEVQTGETLHMMLTINADGTGSMYVNGTLVGTFSNGNLANQTLAIRVEGCGRKNGDTVSAVFTNLKVKNNGTYDSGYAWHTYEFQTCSTITNSMSSWSNITISGTVTGLTDAQDWDNCFSVSDVIQFW